MDDKGFIKFIRESKEFDMLVLRRPSAFVLLSIIAKRAKRSNDHPYPELEMGEALIGDHETYGVTRQIYRTDKEFLEKFKFSTFKTTNRGTIAKLINSSVFDINIDGSQPAKQPVNQPSANHQPTTNKNDKNVKRENNNILEDNTTGNAEKNTKVGLSKEPTSGFGGLHWSEFADKLSDYHFSKEASKK